MSEGAWKKFPERDADPAVACGALSKVAAGSDGAVGMTEPGCCASSF
jgi:hypothetical protein